MSTLLDKLSKLWSLINVDVFNLSNIEENIKNILI